MKTILKTILVLELILCVGCCTVPCRETKVHLQVESKEDSGFIKPPSVGVVFSVDKTY